MNQNRNDETKNINTSSAAKDAAIISKPEKGATANAMRSVQGITPATTMESPVVIAIDHGYGNIKTPTFIFPACVTPCDGDMFLSTDDILTYEDKRYMQKTYGLSNDKRIQQAVSLVAHRHKYHPIRDCLEKLEWDGQERIRHVLHRFLGAPEDDLTAESTKVWLLGAIHRLYRPGCKFDYMLVLVGGQGAGKSTLFRFFALKDEWFLDDLKNLSDDRVFRKLAGHWIVEMSEMIATVNARSVEDIKAFLSRQKDNYKEPYAIYAEDRTGHANVCSAAPRTG